MQTHYDKLRAWCCAGWPCPDDMRDLKSEPAEDKRVWVANATPEFNGLLVLGTPLASREFVPSPN